MGFGSGPESGFGEVPEDMGIGGKLLGSVLFPENEGLNVEVKRRGSKGSGR